LSKIRDWTFHGEVYHRSIDKNLLIREYRFHPKVANDVLERLEQRKLLRSERKRCPNVYKLTDRGKIFAGQLANLYAVTHKEFKPLPHPSNKRGINVGGGEGEIKFRKGNSFTPITQLRVLASFQIGSFIPYMRSTKGVPFILFEDSEN
jgi:predicted transcriptional regulator